MSQSQFDALVQSLDLSTIRLRPGQVIIDQDPLPIKEGSLFLPQRDAQPDHPANTGKILAIGEGALKYRDELTGRMKTYWPQDIKVGDRVVYRLLMSDLNRGRIFTDVRRIDAVIEP